MDRSQIQVSSIRDPLPIAGEPFAVLLDIDHEDWSDSLKVDSLINCLLGNGCRYFVCHGANAEAVHDRIDDLVVEHDYDGVVTTFHEDETKKEVADYFKNVAVAGVKRALVLVQNVKEWEALF